MSRPSRTNIGHAVILAVALFWTFAATTSAWADGWSLKDKEGARYTLAGLRGKWVLVNFWAPWCPPCLNELPGFAALQNRHRNLQIIGVAVKYRSRRDVLEIAAKQATPYPIVFGNEDIVSDFGTLRGLPTSYLFSPTGKLFRVFEGPIDIHDIEAIVVRR